MGSFVSNWHKLMLKRSPIKRSRSKPRPGRVTGKAMTQLREAVWARDCGLCCFCGLPVDFETGQMAHLRGKRMWGDDIDNVRGPSHARCHGESHSPKACPPKVSLDDIAGIAS